MTNAVREWPMRTWRALHARGFIFTFNSVPMTIWDYCLAAAALYCAIYLPFALIFGRWNSEILHTTLDVLFITDVFIKMRTGFRDRGYDVVDAELVRRGYVHGWMLADVVACFPIDLLETLGLLQPSEQVRWLGLLRLLRLLRLGKLWRKLDNFVPEVVGSFRVAGLVSFFLLLGHWFGLMWYAVVILPLEQSGDESELWFWREEPENGLTRQTSVLYVCSLYW